MVEMILPFYQGFYMRLHEHVGCYRGVSTNRMVTYKTEFSETMASLLSCLLGTPLIRHFLKLFFINYLGISQLRRVLSGWISSPPVPCAIPQYLGLARGWANSPVHRDLHGAPGCSLDHMGMHWPL